LTIRSFLTVAAACGFVLAGCDRPKGAPAPQPSEPAPVAAAPVAPIPPRPPEPIHWDEASDRFTLDDMVLKTAQLWRFDGGLENFTAAGALLAPASDGLRLTEQTTDAALRTPQNLSIEGRRYNAVLVRLTRERTGAKWDGSLFYTTAAHGEDNNFHTKPVRGANPIVGETTIMVYDLANPKKGGDDWVTSTIKGLRLDLDDTADGAFVIRQIAVVSLPATVALRPAQ
jgi:hypothetical protein